MNYVLSIERIRQAKYPNIMAEFLASHYSIRTVGDHLGFGSSCPEDDPVIRAKLWGTLPLDVSELFSLAQLWRVHDMDYLMNKELIMAGSETYAQKRWRDMENEFERLLDENARGAKSKRTKALKQLNRKRG